MRLGETYKYIPALVKVFPSLYCALVQNNGLIQCYLPKTYSKPSACRILIKPEFLGFTPEPGEYFSVPAKPAVIGFRIVRDVPIAHSNVYNYTFYADEVLEIVILPPKKPTRPKYKLVIMNWHGKLTGMGGSVHKSCVNANPFFTTASSSSTDRHWTAYDFYLVPLDTKLVFHCSRTSNRGNISEWLEDEDGNTIPRFEETVIKDYEHCTILKVKDNLNNEEFEAIRIYRHSARKTLASTTYKVKKGKLSLIQSDYSSLKTHWTELYKIIEKPIEIEITRTSNRGNTHSYTITYP